jgi:hypothetical protein
MLVIGAPSGCDKSECAQAESEPVDVNESAAVKIEVVDGMPTSLDFGGAYWTASRALDRAEPGRMSLEGVATLTAAQRTEGTISWGLVTLDLGDAGVVEFRGPEPCY